MRRLLPEPAEEPLERLYADLVLPPAPSHRPHVYIGMVSSVDGAVTVDGRSGPLGGDADLQAFRRLRASADAVLAGAGTVRSEDYRGVRLPEDVQAARAASGRDRVPPIVVVTASLDLDPDARLFADTSRPPWLVVPEDRDTSAFDGRSEIVRAGRGRVDLAAALAALRTRGVERLLVEGGPGLNGQLLSQGLVDELFLTVAPVLVGGDGAGPVGDVAGVVDLELLEAHEHEGELLLRYRVAGRVGS